MKKLGETVVRFEYIPGVGGKINVQWLIEDLDATSIELLDVGYIKDCHFAEHHKVTLSQARHLADLMRKELIDEQFCKLYEDHLKWVKNAYE